MKPLTNAELAILSLVAEQPRHGYDIEQAIEARGMREWTEVGFSSIYYILKKLERAGLAESAAGLAERGPARLVYRLTDAGGEALRASVSEALSTPRPSFPPLLLGLANLPALPPAMALAALGQYRERLAARLAGVEARRAAQQPLPAFVDAMFGHSVAMLRAELDWLDGFIGGWAGGDAQPGD